MKLTNIFIACIALFAFLLFLCLLTLITSSDSGYFGDAENYRRASAYCNSIPDFSNNNYIAACVLSGNHLLMLTINITLLATAAWTIYLLLRHNQSSYGYKFSSFLQILKSQTYSFSVLALISPQIIFRFGEPAKEFILYIGLFSIGNLFYDSKFGKTLLYPPLFLLILLTRPSAVPLEILCMGTWIIIASACKDNLRAHWKSMLTYAISCTVVSILVRILLYDIIMIRFPDYYYGNLSNIIRNPLSVPVVSVYNLIGGINSVIGFAALTKANCVYTLDYLWRILFWIYIIRQSKMRLTLYILLCSILAAGFIPYPNPRYLLPLIALGVGLENSYTMKYRG